MEGVLCSSPQSPSLVMESSCDNLGPQRGLLAPLAWGLPDLCVLTLPASALFAAPGWGRRGEATKHPAQGQRLAHQELTILQMDLASSENFWEYTSSVSRTRRSTSSRFTFSLRPRNGDWPSIIS